MASHKKLALPNAASLQNAAEFLRVMQRCGLLKTEEASPAAYHQVVDTRLYHRLSGTSLRFEDFGAQS